MNTEDLRAVRQQLDALEKEGNEIFNTIKPHWERRALDIEGDLILRGTATNLPDLQRRLSALESELIELARREAAFHERALALKEKTGCDTLAELDEKLKAAGLWPTGDSE